MKTRTVPSADYAVGTYTQDIPASAQKKFIGLDMTMTRESWPDGVNYALSDGTVVPNTALVVAFQKTLNGTDWVKVGMWTFPGGVVLNRDGVTPRLSEKLTLAFLDGQGQPIAEDGDLRVVFHVLVALRTGITANMREVGD